MAGFEVITEVLFTHDDGPDIDLLRISYQRFKEKNPRTVRRLFGFAGLDDKKCPPLQAADMVSNYAMQLGLEALKSRNGNLKAVCKEMKSSVKKLGYWDEEYILGYLKSQLVHRGKPIPIDLENVRYD